MKRVGPIVDHALVSVWTFLILFFLGAMIHISLPVRWQFRVDTNTVVLVSVLILCALTTTRFLTWMEYPQWIAGPTLAGVTFIYWIRPGPAMSWWEMGTVAIVGGTVVLLVLVPLHRWGPVRIKMRLPWRQKTNKAAKLAKEAMELKARIEK